MLAVANAAGVGWNEAKDRADTFLCLSSITGAARAGPYEPRFTIPKCRLIVCLELSGSVRILDGRDRHENGK